MSAESSTNAQRGLSSPLRLDVLSETLSDVVLEFFESYAVKCVAGRCKADRESDADELGAIIGFRGGNVSGSLAFVAPVELVAKLLPVPAAAEGADSQIRDWCSEIANQLLGRLKNKVARYELDFDVGTPVCFFGRSIRLVFTPEAEGSSLGFRAESLDMQVHLDCSADDRLLGATSRPPRIAAEGEVILF